MVVCDAVGRGVRKSSLLTDPDRRRVVRLWAAGPRGARLYHTAVTLTSWCSWRLARQPQSDSQIGQTEQHPKTVEDLTSS